ncbi:hypothetical protein BG015_011438 [Linnemannia schmuckeri]|uniref:Glycosyltransferase 61 catalytic domain-containing protein n=1 Tax=Linnemannia schmuckeri TaxID=64567 RepID=A0A9P5RSP1_9FUNG|nr:hypothetical protein BG015_011438 [Linnemannia schmuckeri]
MRAFIRSSGLGSHKNIPKVNLLSAGEDSDAFWQPRLQRSWRNVIQAHYVNETVFVHGLYSPFHFSHWLYNGMLPLYSTMKRFGGTKDSWTLRAARYQGDPIDRQGTWEMDHFFQTGKELVLSQAEMSTPFQTLPPSDAPICFQRAVIGLGSQCALSYCENNIPAEIYKRFREEIAEYFWSTSDTWSKHLKNAQEAINSRWKRQEQEHNSRQDKGAEKKRQEAPGGKAMNSPLKCLELARYYNFEAAGPNHGLEHGEAESRVGQMHPDVADPPESYQNLFVESNAGDDAGKASKRKLVVGIIQREKSRRLLNDDELIQGLIQAGFRVKWMSFDHGCGIAETAYLLRDVNVLITPHGNAIGTSVFMPSHDPVPTILSVDSSRYKEAWFMFTATAIGQRFTQTMCGPSNYVDDASREHCPYHKDLKSGHDTLGSVRNLVLGLPDSMVKTDKEKASMSGSALDRLRNKNLDYVNSNPAAQKLAEEEMDALIGPEQPNALIRKYGEDIWTFLLYFWKEAPRYVDVVRVVKFVQSLQRDLEQEKLSEATISTNTSTGIQQNQHMGDDGAQKSYRLYVEYVRKGRACGLDGCSGILERNVANETTSAFGKHSIDDTSKWGQPTSESQAMREGLTPGILETIWRIET